MDLRTVKNAFPKGFCKSELAEWVREQGISKEDANLFFRMAKGNGKIILHSGEWYTYGGSAGPISCSGIDARSVGNVPSRGHMAKRFYALAFPR